MSFDNLPWDLKSCPNWVCWTYVERDGKQTKVPLNPNTGQAASTSDPSTWASFEVARRVADENKVGIGFVFTNSPFAGVDLDATTDANLLAWHKTVCDSLQSYSERSPSGKGLHVIVRGSVPHGKKDKSKACEVYSDGRFFTCTGDTYQQLPIAERNEQLNELWNQLGGGSNELPQVESGPETEGDEQLLARINRSNNEQFRRLWEGDLSAYANDHSSADQALMNMLAHYSKSHEQVLRLFRRSALGQRNKAYRADYINRTLARAYDRPTEVDLSPVSAFQAAMMAGPEEWPEEDLTDEAVAGFELTSDDNVPWPPGVAGRMAQEIYAMSRYPRRRVAISSALSVLSLMCGRSWHVGTMGLNLYTVLLGKTGLGKSDGIDCATRLVGEIDRACASVSADAQLSNRVRKEFISKQGMHRDLSEHKGILWVIDEWQIRMASMLSAYQGTPDHAIKSFITASYTESGVHGHLGAMVYAKKDNSFAPVSRPNVVIYGLGVPEQFWQAVNYEQLQDGFLNRLLLLECPDNEDSQRNRQPITQFSDELIKALVQIVYGSIHPHQASTEVGMTPGVEALDFQYSEHYRLNGSEKAKFAQARVSMNTMKVAGLLAIANNPYGPVITETEYHWAHGLVSEGARRMIYKFDSGATGSGDGKCLADLRQALRQYFDPKGTWQKRPEIRKLGEGVIAYRHLSKAAGDRASFRNHPRGLNQALEITLKRLIDDGVIVPYVTGNRGGRGFKLNVKWRNI